MAELPTWNGWKNRPTWLVAMWLMNTERDYFAVRGMSAEELKEYVDELREAEPDSGMFADLLGWALEYVDWKAIEEALR